MEKRVIRTVQDLEVYNLSYSLALEIHSVTKKFPKEETYSLTGQIRRCSRSIPANISEGFAKRSYENIFKNHLNSAIGSGEETKTWLDFARDLNYMSGEDSERIKGKYTELGAMLYRLMRNWKSY